MPTPLPKVTTRTPPPRIRPAQRGELLGPGGARRRRGRRMPAQPVPGAGRVRGRARSAREDAHPALDEGQSGHRPDQPRSLGGRGRDADDDARDVAQDGERVVVVEVAAEALLVGEPGDPDDHAVVVLAVAEEAERRGLAPELVLGVVQVGEVLDLRDGSRPASARRGRGRGWSAHPAGCRRPARCRRSAQPAGQAVDPALDPDVLTEHHASGRRQQVVERSVDRLGEGERTACSGSSRKSRGRGAPPSPGRASAGGQRRQRRRRSEPGRANVGDQGRAPAPSARTARSSPGDRGVTSARWPGAGPGRSRADVSPGER